MTLVFGIPLALLCGIIIGRRPVAYVVAGIAWYCFLAAQTAYLADPKVTGFFNQNGLDALQGPVYWILQPILLAVILGAVWCGGRLRQRVTARGVAPAEA